MATTSIDLGDHFTSFLGQLKASGRYKNASEAVRAGLRLLEREEADFHKVEWLRNEIIAGEESGLSTKTHAEIIAEAKAELNAK